MITLLGCAVIVRLDIASRRDAFQAQARTAHRVLSQAVSRLDAVISTLVLVAPSANELADPEATGKLSALYPQVIAAWRRDPHQSWPASSAEFLDAAESRSRNLSPSQRHAVLAEVNAQRGHYTMVLAGLPGSYALRIDAHSLIAPVEWPWAADEPIRAVIAEADQTIVLHDVVSLPARPFGLTDGFTMSKTLDSPSQPFEMQVQRLTGPGEWPWIGLAGWTAAASVLFFAAYRWRLARRERLRSQALATMAQASRLGTLGELAAGIAHELNQPLTAVLSSTQAALRILREWEHSPGVAPPGDETASARQALELASAQARRAADVVARLRHLVQQPGVPASIRIVDLAGLARRAIDLLAPEFERRSITVQVIGPSMHVNADPVALEQILHNLLSNAMQALERGSEGPPRISVTLSQQDDQAHCAVSDNGPGIDDDTLPRLFEPFFTTRAGGLGLGLPLCQSLALAMDGRLVYQPDAAHGARFVLQLPLAQTHQRQA